MKKGRITNWNLDGSEESLLFFAQRMNELLFDYTLDSYKYYALNISLLISESLMRISKIDGELIKDQNLISIIEETNKRSQKDIVTKNILGNQYELFFPIKVSNDRKKIILTLELLSNRLSLSKVIKSIFNQLPIEIKNNSKDAINVLSNNLVTALINVGFHQSYIYHQTNNFFFSAKTAENRKIETFFNKFDTKKKDYQVILKVSDSFLEIKDICKKYDLELYEEMNIKKLQEKPQSFISSQLSDQIFVKCTKILAYDSQSARRIALDQLNGLASFFTYFHHKNPPQIERNAIVKEGERYFLIEPSISSMAKGEDMSHEDAGKFLTAFLNSFSTNRPSRIRLNRAVNLHSQALTSTSNENRILNLWICYETLFGGGKTTTVIHIINSLTHICSLKYFERIFNELSKSVRMWNRMEFNQIKKITNQTNDTKAICVFSLSSEYSAERMSLYQKLNEFPLLRHRINELNRNLKSADKILNYLSKHNEKIKWHIKRLYRTRNQIVHDGYMPQNLEILVENAHSYFDIFMDDFIVDNMISKSVRSINQAVANSELLNIGWQKLLKSEGGAVAFCPQ